jgi:hypothetical protein
VKKPVPMLGYALGVFAGSIVWWAQDAIGAGNFSLFLLVPPLMAFWVASFLIGLWPFVLLRKLAPAESLNRLGFIALVFTPIAILAPCLLGVHSFRFDLSKLAMAETIIFMTLFGGATCWMMDRASGSTSTKSESMTDQRSLRLTLRRLVRGVLGAVKWILISYMSVALMITAIYESIWLYFAGAHSLNLAISDVYKLTLVVTMIAGMMCYWAIDSASGLASQESKSITDHGSLLQTRAGPRRFVRAVKWVLASYVSVALLMTAIPLFRFLYSAGYTPGIASGMVYCWFIGLSCPPP